MIVQARTHIGLPPLRGAHTHTQLYTLYCTNTDTGVTIRSEARFVSPRPHVKGETFLPNQDARSPPLPVARGECLAHPSPLTSDPSTTSQPAVVANLNKNKKKKNRNLQSDLHLSILPRAHSLLISQICLHLSLKQS